MKSRYDIMTESKEINNRGLNYPDVLTFNIKDFVYNYATKKITITERYKDRFYLACFLSYSVSIFDDIVLWLNNKGSIHDLVIGESLYFPDKRDIETFLINNRM